MTTNKSFDHNELPALGWITIESIGDERVYFIYEEDGKEKRGFYFYC